MMGRTLRGTRIRWGQTTPSHPEDKASQVRWLSFYVVCLCPHKSSQLCSFSVFWSGGSCLSFPIGDVWVLLATLVWMAVWDGERWGFVGVVTALSRCFQRFSRSVCLSHSASWRRLLIQDPLSSLKLIGLAESTQSVTLEKFQNDVLKQNRHFQRLFYIWLVFQFH